MIRLSGTFALAALVAALAGCGGLSSRPDWAKVDRLPPDHPAAAQYPQDRYLTLVAGGAGKDPMEAKESARQKAVKRLADEVVLAYRLGAGEGAAGSGGEAYRTNVERVAVTAASGAFAAADQILAWDGSEDRKEYHYGCFALDKDRAGEISLQQASSTFDRLAGIRKRMADGGTDPDEQERLALEAIQRILELGLLKRQCILLGKGTAWIEDHTAVELECARMVHAAGERREASGSERDIEEALKFYTEAATWRQDPLLEAAIARVRARRPCQQCKPALAEAHDLDQRLLELRTRLEQRGIADEERARVALEATTAIARRDQLRQHEHRFFQERAGDLRDWRSLDHECTKVVHEYGARLERAGSERDLEQALKFYEECARSRSDKVLEGRIIEVKKRLPCLECQRGRQCVQCRGERGRWVACPTCRGSTKKSVTCPKCSGDGREACDGCGGTGRVPQRCTACSSGVVACDQCGGSGVKPSTCSQCGGSGRRRGGGPDAPPCRHCNGAGSFSYRCSCDRGQRACPTCGGDMSVDVACVRCGGRGRAGTCELCRGAKTVVVDCTACTRGQVFEDDPHCKGTGVCPTCGGTGTRK